MNRTDLYSNKRHCNSFVVDSSCVLNSPCRRMDFELQSIAYLEEDQEILLCQRIAVTDSYIYYL